VQEVQPLQAAVLQLPVFGRAVVAAGVVVPMLPCDAIEMPVHAVRPAACSDDAVTVLVKVLMDDTKADDALPVV